MLCDRAAKYGKVSYHWRLFFELKVEPKPNVNFQKSVELHVALIRAASGLSNTIGISRAYGHTLHEFKRLELQLAKTFTWKWMCPIE
ncbi:hypothetical protein POSPLADRAFT_1060789 [Postia placenta MAD-698-R-SB12]|uniref:Uncharacterized protein n=1 Tax=Postia placenta MAD-698-R-SB12 TaxID=670580 RepID=A0A1X6MPE5_9APHY|nr:hypothetical protein POSPLADRAFT_1060789 [Postia placenta MAD-698-R-SB12]OSX58287.1 hypothetical protein POSPLADRAFT_1060789 [Postia placenta MAD-698-R-SB12]